jgi:hypothetical protein
MSIIKVFAVSCSADVECDVRKLNIWGEWRAARWLPDTIKETKKRIEACRKENKCAECDAEIQRVRIKRSKKTIWQIHNDTKSL